MNAIPNSFLNGAAYIKRSQVEFKSDCLAMANIVTNTDVKAQLIAASKAGPGKSNTGLSEKGWRPFAEVLGMCAPSSSKLIIPSDVSPAQHKLDVMGYWLVNGVYTSSRIDGKGGSRAIKDSDALYFLGLTAKGAKKPQQVREVPEIELDNTQFELDLELDL